MKRQGWVSQAGEKLDFNNNEATCPLTGEKYKLLPARKVHGE